jgi:molybdopterin synthase catalytic subunit
MIHIAVSSEPIDAGAELRAIHVAGAGGVASFTGLVRGDDGVETLELEHYPGVTQDTLTRLADEATARWDLVGVRIVHRVGAMVPGDTVVFVGTAARHRAPALDACAFLIDRLKTGAPFWKRETRADGARWVEQHDSDRNAAARWD